MEEVNTTADVIKELNDAKVSMKDYALLGTLLAIGIISAFKSFDDHKELPLGQRIRKTIYGIGGSMITTWVVFEGLMYYGDFPLRMNLAIAAAFGYIGAEAAIKFFTNMVERKFDTMINKSKGEHNV